MPVSVTKIYQEQWLGANDKKKAITTREGEQIKYLPLIEEIRRCNKEDDFIFLAIWGKQRKGKSTLMLGLDWWVTYSWRVTLDVCLGFTLPDIMEKIYSASFNSVVLPLLNWDDLGVHGGKRTKSHEGFFRSFSECFDAIGTTCHGLIATMVRPDSTVPALRERYFGEVLVDPRGHFKYMLYDWRISYYHPSEPYFTKVFVEEGNFSELPRPVYKEYFEDRKRLLNIKIAETMDRMYVIGIKDKDKITITELEKMALQKITGTKNEEINDDTLKEYLYKHGFEKNQVQIALSRLESQMLMGKSAKLFKITARGKEIMNKRPEMPESPIP